MFKNRTGGVNWMDPICYCRTYCKRTCNQVLFFPKGMSTLETKVECYFLNKSTYYTNTKNGFILFVK